MGNGLCSKPSEMALGQGGVIVNSAKLTLIIVPSLSGESFQVVVEETAVIADVKVAISKIWPAHLEVHNFELFAPGASSALQDGQTLWSLGISSDMVVLNLLVRNGWCERILGPSVLKGEVMPGARRLDGKKALVAVPTKDLDPVVLGLFFAARCCSEITPQLAGCYHSLKRKGFEIVFVSQDHPSAFEDHFFTMPWMAVPPNDAEAVRERLPMLGEALGEAVMPSLILLNKDGIITTEGLLAVLQNPQGFPWTGEASASNVLQQPSDADLKVISTSSCDLLEALRNRDYAAVNAALDAGANPNAVYRFKDARTRSANMASGSDVSGCPPCTQFPEGCSAMHDIINATCPALCIACGAAGPAPPGKRTPPGKGTPEQEAALEQVVRRMLAMRADPEGHGLEVDDDGSGGYYDPRHQRSPIELARLRGSPNLVTLLQQATHANQNGAA